MHRFGAIAKAMIFVSVIPLTKEVERLLEKYIHDPIA